MKKLIAIALFFGAFYLVSPSETLAQEVSTEMTKEQKKAC